MAVPGSHAITDLLHAWNRGEADALERLVPLVYGELHRLAQHYIESETPGRTLQTTALVNEAYLRLAGSGQRNWRDRSYFFGACAQIMRRILVDSARSRKAVKRGSGFQPLALKSNFAPAQRPRDDLVEIDDALTALARIDPRRARVVECRFFGGLSVQQTGEALRISSETVMRDWKLAKSWLRRELTREQNGGL